VKKHYSKIWLLTFCVVFILFSCEKDSIENEVSTTQNQRPEKQTNFITTEEAKDVAINFLNQSKSDDRSEVTKDDIKEVQAIVNEEEAPIMYAVNLNDDNGFVVISASFLERPILAYSENGNFDFETIGEYNGVVDWAYTTYLTINQRIENKKEPDDEVVEQWGTFGYQARVPEGCFLDEDHILVCPDNPDYYPPYVEEYWYETITKGPLLATEWGQKLDDTNPIGYNNFVRYYNCPNGTAPAGCVAVAMGQIMKYHNHPNIYNINTMPDKVTYSNQTFQNAKNIAYLLQDIGTNVSMNYSCNNSGAYSQDARTAFVNNY